eukprot:SAG31_NODE_16417_length_710_cov_0.785597_1_plen_98_part_10
MTLTLESDPPHVDTKDGRQILAESIAQQTSEHDALLSAGSQLHVTTAGAQAGSCLIGWGWLQAVLVLSGAFFCLFTAYHATQNLQSTLPFPPSVSGTV